MFVKIVKTLNGIIERMTPRQLLITAAVAGVVMCLLIYLTLQSFEQEIIAEQEEPVEMQKVVVATVDISRGATINPDMMRLAEFAKSSIPKGSAADIRAFQGLPARVDILSGDIITDQKVYSDIRQAGFIGMIPPDCRAMTIPIDNVTGVAGLLVPGDYVDLLLISGGDYGRNNGVKGEVLLQNILLLSIDKNINRLSGEIDLEDEIETENKTSNELEGEWKDVKDSAEQVADIANTMHNQAKDTFAGKGFEAAKSGKSMRGLGDAGKGDGNNEYGTATLALKTEDVLKVATAMQSGTIHLALRPFKPNPTSMFIAETEYYKSPPAPVSTPPVQTVSRPVAASTTNRPAPAYQPPRSSVPYPVQNFVPPALNDNPSSNYDPGYEVIKWGQ